MFKAPWSNERHDQGCRGGVGNKEKEHGHAGSATGVWCCGGCTAAAGIILVCRGLLESGSLACRVPVFCCGPPVSLANLPGSSTKQVVTQ
jgi:hypothetical protein